MYVTGKPEENQDIYWVYNGINTHMADDGYDYDPNIIAHQRKEAAPLTPEEIQDKATAIRIQMAEIQPETMHVEIDYFDLTGQHPRFPENESKPLLIIDDNRPKKGKKYEIGQTTARIQNVANPELATSVEWNALKPSQLGQLSEIVQAVTLAFAQATLQEE